MLQALQFCLTAKSAFVSLALTEYMPKHWQGLADQKMTLLREAAFFPSAYVYTGLSHCISLQSFRS